MSMSNSFVEASLDAGGDAGAANVGTDVQRWKIPVVQQSTNAGLLSHTEEAIEQLRQDTYESAYQQGLADGIKSGEQQCLQKLQYVDEITQAISQPLAVLDQALQQALSTLITEIVRKVCVHELSVSSSAICQIVEKSINLLDESEEAVSLFMHPDDAELLQTYQHQNTSMLNCKIIAQAQLQRGDVHVQCGHQFIRESLDERIDRIAEHVLNPC